MKRTIAALSAVLVAAVAFAGPAAAGGSQRPAEPPLAVSIGEAGTTVPSESLFGQPRIVPGDRFSRHLDVTTTSSGTLTVQIVNLTAGAEPPSGSVDTAWERDLTLAWTTPDGTGGGTWHDLKSAGDQTIAVLPAAAGEVHRMTLGYDMPWEAVSGNGTHPQATFDVRLSMRGDDPTTPPTPSPPDKQIVGGFPLIGGTSPWLVAAGVGLLAVALVVAVVAVRRRTRPDDGGPLVVP